MINDAIESPGHNRIVKNFATAEPLTPTSDKKVKRGLSVKGNKVMESDATIIETDNSQGHERKIIFRKSLDENASGMITRKVDDEEAPETLLTSLEEENKVQVSGFVTEQSLPDGMVYSQSVSGKKVSYSNNDGKYKKDVFVDGEHVKEVTGDLSDFESNVTTQTNNEEERLLNQEHSNTDIKHKEGCLHTSGYTTHKSSLTDDSTKIAPNKHFIGKKEFKEWDAQELTATTDHTGIKHEDQLDTLIMADASNRLQQKKINTKEEERHTLLRDEQGGEEIHHQIEKANVKVNYSEQSDEFKLIKTPKPGRKATPLEVEMDVKGIKRLDVSSKKEAETIRETRDPNKITSDHYTHESEAQMSYDTSCIEGVNKDNENCKPQQQEKKENDTSLRVVISMPNEVTETNENDEPLSATVTGGLAPLQRQENTVENKETVRDGDGGGGDTLSSQNDLRNATTS